MPSHPPLPEGTTPTPATSVADGTPALSAAADEVPRVAARIGARVAARIGARVAREETRLRTPAYLRGLLSPLERKNGWQLAEAAGDRTPYATQHLLGRAEWDADAVRDDLRASVVAHLGDPEAVLVVDETGVVKKGHAAAGVATQYVGAVGKLENAQVGVYLAYASPQGTAFLDRALYLPEEWTDDPARCQQAGIPETAGFATKPQLAQAQLARALGAGVPAAWVTADSVYGDDRRLRVWLEAQEQPDGLAVSGKESVDLDATWTPQRVSRLLQELPTENWQRLAAGDGAKGPRWYDWQRVPLVPPLLEGFARWCLVRRRLADPTDRQAYVVFAPEGAALEDLVRVAGQRWTIEVAFEQAKGEVGLDQYEVRRWTGYYRHMTLALFAPALLTVVRLRLATAPAGRRQKGRRQQAVSRRWGSLATFRRQRRTPEGHWPRRAPRTPPSPTSSR